MANHNLYIPEKYEKLLEERKTEEESIGQCAKRLLLSFLDSEVTSDSTLSNDLFTDQLNRLESLEEKLEALTQVITQVITQGDRLESLENGLTNLDSEYRDRLGELEDLERKIYSLDSKYGANLGALEERLETFIPAVLPRLEAIEELVPEMSRVQCLLGSLPVKVEAFEARLNELTITIAAAAQVSSESVEETAAVDIEEPAKQSTSIEPVPKKRGRPAKS